jgi:hypothetical protein
MIRPIDVLKMGPTYKETRTERGWLVKVTPPTWAKAGTGASIELTEDQYRRYQLWRNTGSLIQNALPELTAAQREILMTGMDDDTFHKYIGPESDED